ncbi:hypothetical protein C2E21_2068 [Chlorella sorokiniana]|uniref:Uncharacterized protein n=1 Tax=Chlorella sorokiniana TaxID=3076 RepID=A0A2P6TXS1_CHLSO|nr:hypothetical protein C2E21_2068 [Chlorella sorokiniana]|eukprot:PRW58865.1 hypothetical protein C2E21_2068 [Chlorella sorokiniana]
MSSSGGPLERLAEPLASQDSWKELRVDSRQGRRPGDSPAGPDAPPPAAAANEEAPEPAFEGQAPPAELSAAPVGELHVKEEEQPAEQPGEEAPPQEAAALLAASEAQVAEPAEVPLPAASEAQVAKPAEVPLPEPAAAVTQPAEQDGPPSTASTVEGDQAAQAAGAHRRHSHKGGPRGPRRKLTPLSGEGAAGGEAAEPQAGGEGRQEGGGILAELEAHRQQQKQLVVEGKVRQELESMLQRIEGHFRTEQAARRRTEEALALAAGERDALRGQLEAERMQQAALLQQAMQERGMLEAQLAAMGAELEQTRQESAARLEAMAAEAAAWRASAEGVAQQAEQARRELAERAAEIEGTSMKMRSLAELLATPGSPPATQDASFASPAGGSPGTGRLEGLQFHRGAPGGSGGGSGGKAKSRLPHLKTRAIPGATLRQTGGEGGSPVGSPGIGALPSLSPGSRGLQRERSTGGGVAWAASGKAADRSAESQRDYARTAHMARWNKA